MHPEAGLWTGGGSDKIGRRGETGVGVDDVTRQLLKVGSIAGGKSEEAFFDLRLGPGADLGAIEGAGVAVPVNRFQHCFAGSCRDCPECHADGATGGDKDRAGQRQNRIEYGAGVAIERLFNAGWIGSGATATDKAAAVGFPADFAGCLAFDDSEMGKPDGLFMGVARAPMGDEDRAIKTFSLDEHAGESGVSEVICLGTKRKFDERGYINVMNAVAAIGDGDAADFGIIFGGDEHFGCGGERAIASPELGATFGEDGRVLHWLDAAGRQGSRPALLVLAVTYIEPAAIIGSNGIIPPAVERHAIPTAVASTGAGEEH